MWAAGWALSRVTTCPDPDLFVHSGSKLPKYIVFGRHSGDRGGIAFHGGVDIFSAQWSQPRPRRTVKLRRAPRNRVDGRADVCHGLSLGTSAGLRLANQLRFCTETKVCALFG